jgi:hypothetical protein
MSAVVDLKIEAALFPNVSKSQQGYMASPYRK